MLHCLITTYVEEGRSIEATESEVTTPRSRKQTYYCFVNKLAQICDSRFGGKTVTAFAVLQPGSVEYRFGCNERKASALGRVKLYITEVLDTLGNAGPDHVEQAATDPHTPLFSQLLEKIVKFNRPRIERYVDDLASSLEICIEESSREDSNEGIGRLNVRFPFKYTNTSPAREVTADLEALFPLVQFGTIRPKVTLEECKCLEMPTIPSSSWHGKINSSQLPSRPKLSFTPSTNATRARSKTSSKRNAAKAQPKGAGHHGTRLTMPSAASSLTSLRSRSS
jgi:hypothetical protein